MKTPEDEAFDDLAKRQGDWGGGFPAKRAMAADKLQEPWNEDEWRRNNWRCGHGWLRGEQCEICNAPQPAQEPVAWAKYDLDRMAVAFDRVIDAHHSKTNPFHNPINADAVLALRILRGFIPAMKVYTTTPQREWVGLTDDDKAELAKAQHSWEDLCLAVEAKLKEKNTCQQ